MTTTLRRFGVSASALAALATTLTFPTSAQAAPVTTYKPGRYNLVIEDVYVVDPQSTIDPNDRCVELFGSLTIAQGNSSYSYFQSPRKRPVDVCEPLVTLNEGRQVATIPKNGNWGKGGTQLNFLGDTADKGWALTADLYDADGPSGYQRICRGSTTLKPQGDRFRYVWDCHGERGAQVNVHFLIQRYDPQQTTAVRELLKAFRERVGRRGRSAA
ncbi:hypothetical protein ABZ442_20055 [Streptomyces triculaminicus]|uniref:hypothetical protein n=1 Tax=Streptomyces triculaminicus TaxID=2816232 RepID=UPI0033F7CEA6